MSRELAAGVTLGRQGVRAGWVRAESGHLRSSVAGSSASGNGF